jgi:hypothetical protein
MGAAAGIARRRRPANPELEVGAMTRSLPRRAGAPALAAAAALLLSACVEIGPGGPEAKVGIGPFKAGSIELGPGGAEAKGPSAGPVGLGDDDKDDDEKPESESSGTN